MRMASNSSSWVTCLNRSSSAFITNLLVASRWFWNPSTSRSITLEVDVDREGADLLHEHVERLRHAGLDLVLALHDVLVDLRASLRVVRLDGEHLLERVGRAVRLQRPHLHLAEALAAELRLAAQRLLGDQGVRPRRARVHLVVDQVMELEDVHVAHGHRAVERVSRAAVEERDLTAPRKARELEHVLDLLLGRA